MRRRDGFHGLAIQWGPIGDVGVMADNESVDKVSGIVKQRILSCLEVMDKFLQFPDAILSSFVSILSLSHILLLQLFTENKHQRIFTTLVNK
jgi:hypothetical protein